MSDTAGRLEQVRAKEERTLGPRPMHRFGKRENPPLPPLTELQKRAWERFLQADTPPEQRLAIGLEAILAETFPIRSHDGSRTRRYLRYELGEPVRSLEECRRLRLTYARPLNQRRTVAHGDSSGTHPRAP